MLSEQTNLAQEKEALKSIGDDSENADTGMKAKSRMLRVKGSIDSENKVVSGQGFKRLSSIFSPKPIQSAFLSSAVLTAVSVLMIVGISFAAYRLSLNPLDAETIAKIRTSATIASQITGGIAFFLALYTCMTLDNSGTKSNISGIVCMAFVSLCALSISARVATDVSISLSTLPLSSELGPTRFFDWLANFLSENNKALRTAAMTCMFMNMVWSLVHEKVGRTGGIWLDLFSLQFALVYTWTLKSRSILFKFFMLMSLVSAINSYCNIVL